MNLKLFGCIAMGVFVVHLGVFMILGHLRPKPPKPLEPNFKVRSQTVVDRETGETTVYREITVSTRLGTPSATPRAEKFLAEPPISQAVTTTKPAK